MRPWVLGPWLLFVLGASCTPGSNDSPRAPAPRPDQAQPSPATPETEPEPSSEPAPPVEPPTAEPEPPTTEPEVLSLPASGSTSTGHPTHGRLEGGVALPLRASGLVFNPAKDPSSRFGTVELVQGLVRAAAAVEQASPGAPLTVGDLALEGGGDLAGHASHRTGRDVDVLFYLRHEAGEGEPFVPSKAIPLDPDGRGTDYRDLADPADDIPVRLDAERTWSFVAALLADEAAAVQRIFVVEHVRSLLLDEARRVGAPPAIVQRFSEVTCQPRFPHDDHMHIRVFCSPEDVAAGCEDTRPLYPWRTQVLAAAGVKPVLSNASDDPKPKRTRKLKTLAQARAEAGPMHEDVVEFLDRRTAWAKQPHPGRRWCR